MPAQSEPLIAKLRAIAAEPERLDHDPDALVGAYQRYCHAGFPVLWPRQSPWENFQTLAAVAEVSGALAFLALQQYVASFYLGGEIDDRCGVAFGHIRNPEAKAVAMNEEGVVSGVIPWLTGPHVFERVVLGFHQGDEEVFSLVDSCDRPEFRWGLPMDLLALRATNTVRVEVDGLLPGRELTRKPIGTMRASDRKGVVWQTPLLLGCGRAAFGLIKCSSLPRVQVDRVAERLEYLALRAHELVMAPWQSESGLRLRSKLGSLAVRLARLAAMASGGQSLFAGHPAERIYREALVFNLMAQTPEIVVDAAVQELV